MFYCDTADTSPWYITSAANVIQAHFTSSHFGRNFILQSADSKNHNVCFKILYLANGIAILCMDYNFYFSIQISFKSFLVTLEMKKVLGTNKCSQVIVAHFTSSHFSWNFILQSADSRNHDVCFKNMLLEQVESKCTETCFVSLYIELKGQSTLWGCCGSGLSSLLTPQ